MNEAAYLRAAFPDAVRVLGQDLEDYSLCHEMLLRQQRNVFVLPREELDQADPDGERILTHLFLATYVCCHSYPEVRKALRRPDLKAIGQKWRARAKDEGVNEAAEVRRFKCYVLKGQYCPPFDPIPQRGRKRFSPGAPWLLLLLKTLVGPLNFSRIDALNLPYPEAQFLYLSYWESQGTVRLLTNEDERKVHKAAAAEGMQVLRFKPGELEKIKEANNNQKPVISTEAKPTPKPEEMEECM